MTQSRKGRKPKAKEKLSDKEQSERFKETAEKAGAFDEDRFERLLDEILAKWPQK